MKEEKPNFEHPQSQSAQPQRADNSPMDFQAMMDLLRKEFDEKLRTQIHNGVNAPRINANTDIIGSLSTTAAGTNGEVQFNDNGTVAGDSGLVYDKNSASLIIGVQNAGSGTVTTNSASVGSGFQGAPLILGTGNGDGSGQAGPIELTPGVAGTSGAGGDIDINASDGGSSSGDGGNINITSGDSKSAAGTIDIIAGNGSGAGPATGGNILIQSGNATGSGANNAGPIQILAGYAGTGGAGAPVIIGAGWGGSSSGAGGRVDINGGGTFGGNSNGGNVNINLGVKSGSGHDGRFNIQTLPTSSAGLSTGDVWNNSGVLNIV